MSGASKGRPDQSSRPSSEPPSGRASDRFSPAALLKPRGPRPVDVILVGMAQGFWIGRMPFMPGTWGTLLGLAWTALLLWGGNLWIFLGGAIAGLALSVWLSGAAEVILEKRDPGSIVIDEIAAVPVCFLGWMLLLLFKRGAPPDLGYFFSGWNLAAVGGVFVAFRFFDIVKPWPVKQSQSLPGGWGVTLDDLLAAIYVNGLVIGVWALSF